MPAATATTRRAKPSAKVLARRRELAEERLRIERKLKPHYDRIDTVDTELKTIATTAGEAFKEEFSGLGSVAVAPAAAAEFKGEVPQIVTEKWTALSEIERKRLLKSGLVVIERQFGKASHGRVTVKATEA